MLIPGYRQTLTVDRVDPHEVVLKEEQDRISIPRRSCPEDVAPGQKLTVFIFLDRNNSLRATTRAPYAQVGEFAFLQVQSTGPHGAFLDWGVEKDLLSPVPEQARRMEEGRRYLVYICHDDNGRPIASSRLEQFLERENRDLEEGQEVDLLVWAFTDLGAKVIVNNRYEALIYRDDVPVNLKRGDRKVGYVRHIRDDGRIDISLSRGGAAGVKDARSVILAAVEEDGFLNLHDQSPPELIRNRLGMSKKVFKKAVGGLYKDGLIRLEEDGIRLK